MTTSNSDDKIAELREVIREANTTLKDMRAAKRELTEAVVAFERDAREWRVAIQKTYAKEMTLALEQGFKDLMTFVTVCEKKLNTRLDTIMMAITKPYQTKVGPLSLDEVLRRKSLGENI